MVKLQRLLKDIQIQYMMSVQTWTTKGPKGDQACGEGKRKPTRHNSLHTMELKTSMSCIFPML